MNWRDYFSTSDLLFIGCVVCFLLLEYAFPNKRYGSDRRWFLLSGLLLLAGVLLTVSVGFLTEGLFRAGGFFPALSRLLIDNPPVLNGLIGYLAVTFINYWWHRFRHQSDVLWRFFHQIHHSTQRIQAVAAFYSHPLDYFSTVVIVNFVAYGLFGLDIESAAFTTVWVGVFEIWEHTNIRTPIWLGYVIARPEMHRIHHEYGKHRNNYGLPLWDIVFGTYENSHRQVDCGFEQHREARVVDMLLLKDVHKS